MIALGLLCWAISIGLGVSRMHLPNKEPSAGVLVQQVLTDMGIVLFTALAIYFVGLGTGVTWW